MQKKTKKNVSPRIFEETLEFYGKLFESINAGAEFVLEAFPELYRRAQHDLKGRFLRGELMLMIDVMNGHISSPQSISWSLPGSVADGIALDRLDEKWEIDGAVLNKKLAEIHYFDRAFLEIWVAGFWNQDDHSNIEEYAAIMCSATPVI